MGKSSLTTRFRFVSPLSLSLSLLSPSSPSTPSLTSSSSPSRNTFSPHFHSTVGVELAAKSVVIDGVTVEAQLWDTPGKVGPLGAQEGLKWAWMGLDGLGY